MYIKEDITINILRNNGFTVNSDLSTFVQEYLNTKYDFILSKEEILDSKEINIINPKQFALLMYIFNSLINVENMEIDNTCYYITYGENNVNTYHIPQDNGYDAVITTNINMSPIFIKSPSFMINGIVHPETFNTKTVYLDLLYKLVLSDSKVNYDILMPFGEGVINMFLEGKIQYINSYRIIDKLILSQFPSFTDYMKSISEYLKTFLQVSFEPSAIKSKSINTNIVFKSFIFNRMKEGVKIDDKYDSKYEETLIQKYHKYINDSLQEVNPLLNNNLYAYPQINNFLMYPYIEELNSEKLISIFRVVFNAEIYFQTFNKVMSDKDMKVWTTSVLEIAYKVKRCHYSILKAFYFSYHMCFDKKYGYLYYEESPIFKPKNVVLNQPKQIEPKETIYYPVWTLNQCNSIRDRDTLLSLILKTVWHNNKFIMRKVEAPVKNLLRGRNNDMYIFKKLNSLYKQFTPKDTGFDKGAFRYNELLKTGVFDKVTKSKNPKNIKYLDFGGGIGDVGASIAKNLGFLKENSFVTDIQNWLGKEHTEEYAKYITYRYLKTNDLPFENDSIDFITCLQVLHHIPDKKYTLSQLYRIIKTDGLLLIREHNCEDSQDGMLIDLEHSLHAFVVDEQGQDYLQNYNDVYMDKLELDIVMKSAGFEKVIDGISFPGDKGITKYYYSLWKKYTDIGYNKDQLTYKMRKISLDDNLKVKYEYNNYKEDQDSKITKDTENNTKAQYSNFYNDLDIKENKPINISSKELKDLIRDESIDNLVNAFKNNKVGFPYMKSFMKPIDTYFSELKNFKVEYSTDVDRLFRGYAKFKIIKNTPSLYVFKEAYKIPSIKSEENIVIILTNKEDYNIDMITNFFTEEARMQAKVCKGKTEECLSPIEYWNKNIKNVIKHVYSKGEDLTNYTMREAMFSLCPEATLFKTTVAKTVYDIFKPKVILDMSSGWGDRLISAIAYSQTVDYDVKYFGYDPNTSLTQGYKNIIDTLAGDNRANFGVKTAPFETADLSYIKEDVDLVFTSPPYFDFEVYSEDKTQSIVQYPTFINWCVNFLFRSLKNAFSKLSKDGYLVMHITDTKNMPNVCELIILFIEGFIGGKIIGTINTQAPGKMAIPMWVFKNVKVINETNKQNMVKYYPEINIEINKSLLPQKKVEPVKKSWADYSDDED